MQNFTKTLAPLVFDRETFGADVLLTGMEESPGRSSRERAALDTAKKDIARVYTERKIILRAARASRKSPCSKKSA